MRPTFDDSALVHHEDLVGFANGTESVGDDEAGAARHQARERKLQAGFSQGINGAGCLVQHEDTGVGHERTGEGHQLLLAEDRKSVV